LKLVELNYNQYMADAIQVGNPRALVEPGLSRPILKNLGFLCVFKKPKKPEKLGF